MITDLAYTVIIAGLFDVLTYNFADHIYQDLEFSIKMEKILFLIFVIGLLSLLVMILYFPKSKYYTKTVSRGIMLGSILLMGYTVVGNWDTITSHIKLLIIGISLASVIWLGYTNDQDNKRKSIKSV